jgi:hypothetical protein
MAPNPPAAGSKGGRIRPEWILLSMVFPRLRKPKEIIDGSVA